MYTREQQDAGNLIESAISYIIWMGDENSDVHEFLREKSFELRYDLSEAWEYAEKWEEIYKMLSKARREGYAEALA